MATTSSAKKNEIQKREFTSAEKNKIVEKLITARIGLLLRHPFFGNLATRLKLVDATEWCGTLATDGRHFYYNNDFVNKLTPKEAEFGFAHEVLHNVFDHMGRRESRDPKLSNIAADYAVNQICKDERIGVFPSFMKVYQDDKYRGMSYEEIYADLYEKAEKIDVGGLGELLDEHLDGEGDEDGDGEGDKEGKGRPKLSEAEKQQIRDEIKEAMLAAAATVDGAGNLPAGVKRLIQDLTEPKMNWRELLRMQLESTIKSDYTWMRASRKGWHMDAVMPGMKLDPMIDIAVSLDASGSISEKMLKDFLGEVGGIMEQFPAYRIHVVTFDTAAYNPAQFDSENLDSIDTYEVKGGGGTDFDCVFNYFKDNEIEPKRHIMFTDGYPGGSWGDEHYCDTVFIIHGNTTIVPPFGQYAYYEQEKSH
jgi:predicted metal-dependent peptidase